jgi:hypothetical protein
MQSDYFFFVQFVHIRQKKNNLSCLFGEFTENVIVVIIIALRTNGAVVMIVCAHGEVSEYCDNHGMVICDQHIGSIEEYKGVCRVLVTDQPMENNEFYALKLKMLKRGVELISVNHSDEAMSEFISYMALQKLNRGGGRRRFGTGSDAEMAVVNRIFELRDAGYTMKQISEDEKVCYLDGRKMSVSTIQVILRNRDKY